MVAQWSRICLPMQEMRVRSLGQEDPLEREMATHASILVWRIPWTEEPGGLQPMGSHSQTRLSNEHVHRQCKIFVKMQIGFKLKSESQRRS